MLSLSLSDPFDDSSSVSRSSVGSSNLTPSHTRPAAAFTKLRSTDITMRPQSASVAPTSLPPSNIYPRSVDVALPIPAAQNLSRRPFSALQSIKTRDLFHSQAKRLQITKSELTEALDRENYLTQPSDPSSLKDFPSFSLFPYTSQTNFKDEQTEREKMNGNNNKTEKPVLTAEVEAMALANQRRKAQEARLKAEIQRKLVDYEAKMQEREEKWQFGEELKMQKRREMLEQRDKEKCNYVDSSDPRRPESRSDIKLIKTLQRAKSAAIIRNTNNTATTTADSQSSGAAVSTYPPAFDSLFSAPRSSFSTAISPANPSQYPLSTPSQIEFQRHNDTATNPNYASQSTSTGAAIGAIGSPTGKSGKSAAVYQRPVSAVARLRQAILPFPTDTTSQSTEIQSRQRQYRPPSAGHREQRWNKHFVHTAWSAQPRPEHETEEIARLAHPELFNPSASQANSQSAADSTDNGADSQDSGPMRRTSVAMKEKALRRASMSMKMAELERERARELEKQRELRVKQERSKLEYAESTECWNGNQLGAVSTLETPDSFQYSVPKHINGVTGPRTFQIAFNTHLVKPAKGKGNKGKPVAKASKSSSGSAAQKGKSKIATREENEISHTFSHSQNLSLSRSQSLGSVALSGSRLHKPWEVKTRQVFANGAECDCSPWLEQKENRMESSFSVWNYASKPAASPANTAAPVISTDSIPAESVGVVNALLSRPTSSGIHPETETILQNSLFSIQNTGNADSVTSKTLNNNVSEVNLHVQRSDIASSGLIDDIQRKLLQAKLSQIDNDEEDYENENEYPSDSGIYSLNVTRKTLENSLIPPVVTLNASEKKKWLGNGSINTISGLSEDGIRGHGVGLKKKKKSLKKKKKTAANGDEPNAQTAGSVRPTSAHPLSHS